MSASRIPTSLRRSFAKVSNAGKLKIDATTTGVVTAACLAAASPLSLAIAQTAQPGPLPPLSVEAKQAKKKTTPAPAKKAGAAPAAPVAATAPTTPLPPGANPYANPEAPYEVVKSANGKFPEPLLDTPKTITATPKAVLDDKSIRDLQDLARSTPGLTIGSAEGGNAFGAFAIRGFKANNDIFVDGVRNPGNVVPDLFATQQVEIYKGPSGGVAGRSTIGGAINIISKQPDLSSSFYEVTTTLGTDHTFRTTVDVNQKVTPDFAFRANVMYDQHNIAGRDITESERWGGLLSATARFSDSLKLTVDYYRYRNDATPDWGVPARDIDNVPVTELGFSRKLWVGMKGLDFFNEKADIVTATLVAKLGEGVTLTNRARVGESRLDYVATSMEGYPDVHHPNRDQTAGIYANQTEVNLKFNTMGLRHNLVAGVDATRETIDRYGYNVTNRYDAQTPTPAGFPRRNFPNNLYDPRFTDVILGKGNVYDATIDTVGLYLMDTIHLSKQWIVNAGIRFDDFSRDQVGGPGINALGSAAANTAIATNTASVQADLLSWHAGIVYKPIPISSFYVAYATSESPVGSELDSTGAQYNGISSQLVRVPPQEARSIEVGTKWELFNKRLLATAAVFQTDVDKARTNDNVTATNPANAFAGKYRVRGIELGAAGNITKAWSVFGGLVLLDTEVLKSSTPQDIGRRLANIPLTQFSMLSRYQFTDKLALAGVATHGGEIYGGHLAANAFNNHTVDWWRFDAFAEYKLTDNVEIKVTGLNLNNEVYYDALYQAQDTFAFVAPGRAGYVTLKVKY